MYVATLFWASTSSGSSIVIHENISLPDATLYDNVTYLTITGDFLYWSDGKMSTVNRLDLNTLTNEQLLPSSYLQGLYFMDITFDSSYLYFVNWNEDDSG